MALSYDSGHPFQENLQAITREAQYLNKLPYDKVLRLNLAGSAKEFPGQSEILAEGSEILEVYLILQGMVTVGLYHEISPSLSLYVAGPGAVVDMCALLEPPVSPVSIYALTDVHALAIPRATFVEVLEDEPALGYEILKHLCTRLSLITRVTLKEFSEGCSGPSRN